MQRHPHAEKMRDNRKRGTQCQIKARRCTMGDKGKKDKDKGRKQKINKQEQKAKEKIEKQAKEKWVRS
jgi:hypothetical protein